MTVGQVATILTALYESPDPETRRAVATSMGWLGAPVVETLEGYLDRPGVEQDPQLEGDLSLALARARGGDSRMLLKALGSWAKSGSKQSTHIHIDNRIDSSFG